MPTLFRQPNSDRCFPKSRKSDDEQTRGADCSCRAEAETERDAVIGETAILPEELPPELQQTLADLMEDAATLGTGIYSRVFPLPRSNQQWIRIRITVCQRNPSSQTLEISRLTAEELLQHFCSRQTEALARLRGLSHREQHVLQLVAAGFPNKAVAIRLKLSSKTVEKHRSHAMKKLGLTCTPEVARFWSSLYWEACPAVASE